MLPLDSPRWGELEDMSGTASGVPVLLRHLAATDDDIDWSEIYTLLCHQGETTYSATYAAVPHLVAIAAARAPRARVPFLVFVGAVAAFDEVALPPDLAPAYRAGLRRCEELIRESVPRSGNELDLLYLALSLASLRGEPERAAFLQEIIDRDFDAAFPAR